MKLLIVGCGYVGSVVHQMAPRHWTVQALTRSENRRSELISAGIEPIVGNWHDRASLQALPAADYILVAVPHRPVAELDRFTHRNGLSNLLASLKPGWSKLVYLSTTGVYGDSGEIVHELTPTAPSRLGPQIAVEAERWLEENVPMQQLTILRLAGIYGPGRIPLAAKLQAGEPLAVPRHGYLNLVHVADIARMVHWVVSNPMRRTTYVFSDGNPVLRTTFYEHLAALCGVGEPAFTDPEVDDTRARRATSKRIDPTRLVHETQFEFEFADYRQGLAHALGLKT